MSVEIGLKGRAEETVTDANTAQAACSGALPVYGTPFMTALMEKAAWTSIAPRLAPGESTVGTAMNITHISASPVGIRVWAESEVTLVDGKRIELKVAAYDQTARSVRAPTSALSSRMTAFWPRRPGNWRAERHVH